MELHTTLTQLGTVTPLELLKLGTCIVLKIKESTAEPHSSGHDVSLLLELQLGLLGPHTLR